MKSVVIIWIIAILTAVGVRAYIYHEIDILAAQSKQAQQQELQQEIQRVGGNNE